MSRLAPITATGDPTDRRVTIDVPSDLLFPFLRDVADQPDEMEALIDAVRNTDRDDAHLAESYSENLPGDQTISEQWARNRADSELTEALFEVVRTIDLAQVRIPAAEARRLANALILAAYHAERQAS